MMKEYLIPAVSEIYPIKGGTIAPPTIPNKKTEEPVLVYSFKSFILKLKLNQLLKKH